MEEALIDIIRKHTTEGVITDQNRKIIYTAAKQFINWDADCVDDLIKLALLSALQNKEFFPEEASNGAESSIIKIKTTDKKPVFSYSEFDIRSDFNKLGWEHVLPVYEK